MDESHKHAEQKKPGTKENILHNSIYIKQKNRYNVISAVRNQDSDSPGQGRERLRGASGRLGLCSLDLGAAYTGVFVCAVASLYTSL